MVSEMGFKWIEVQDPEKVTLTHRNQFDKVKSMICENISLNFLDPKLPTDTNCYSSKFGIGATLEKNLRTISIP